MKMKRCSRIISFFLALTLLIGLLPGSLVIPAFAAVEPKYVVSSNVELTEDTNSTTAPALKKSYITNDVIDKSKGQVFLLANYSSIKDKFPLAYVEIDGLKVYLSDFERYTSLTKIDTSSCPNLQGREVQIRLFKSCPQFKFVKDTGNDITSDIKINFVFQTQAAETEYKLNATAGENGTILQTEYLHSTDDGNSVYGLWVRPDNQYQLLSYTMGSETVSIELKNENYVTWQFPEPDDFGRTYTACNYFELEISKDSDITLNFGPATVELKLVGYMPDHWGLTFYTLFRFSSDRDKLIETMGYDTIPLVEGSGAKFCYTLQVNGFLDFDVDTTDEDTYAESEKKYKLESFKIYNGTETNEDALLFSMDDPNAIKETYGLSDPHEQWLGGKWPQEYIVYTGWKANVGHAAIARCPDLKQITTEVVAYGRTTTLTSDVKMVSDVKEAKDFLQYYTDNYGLDKMGQEAYTEEEKQTDAYKLYCQYSTFRYEMRKVYQEQALKVAFADDPAAALEEAKAALDAAARGEGCNAVSWSFNQNEMYGTHNKPTLTALPNDGDNVNKTGTSASDAMCAALEAEYPGNWTYNCTSTQFGMFVNSVTAGGENDTGRMNIRDGTNGPGMSYGFWYYNGKFSEWGVSNYYPYDGDVMSWGNPDVARSWALAILRFHYKNNGGDDALEKDMADRGVSFTSSGEALEKAFPEYNFSRYGQFREVTEAELVIQLINAIGTVSPDSGEAITAARKAYDALSEAEQKEVYNYSTLTDAEAAFAKLSQAADVKYEDALANTLAKLNQTKNVGIGSTNGEWLVLALARGGIISGTDTSGIGASYLNTLFTALRDSQGTKLTLSTDYARVTLAMSALGVEAPDSVLDVVRDYDRVTAQGINAVVYALLALDSKPYDKGDDALRDKYVAFLLDNACESGGWVYGGDKTSTADVDMTAMAIQALAPYYLSGDANVKTAVDKGLSALKTMQKSTGGFSSYGTYNAESTAQVIVALTALGIDPTSAEWKQTGDPIEALLHFYDASASMFRHTTNGKADQMATEQSAYALVAYNRFVSKQNTLYDMSDAFSESGEVKDPKQTVASAKLEIGAMGRQTVSMAVANTEDEVKSYIDTRLKLLTTKGPTYEVSVRKLVPAVAGTEEDPGGTGGSFIAEVTISMDGVTDTADIHGTITATKYEAPKEDITVTFQLLGDEHHEIKTDADIHTYRFNADEMPVWIDTVTVTVPGGSTVGDLFKKVMDENGFTYEGLDKGYIRSISQPNGGISLRERDDDRPDSGWMYLVNGVHPGVGLNSYELSDGEIIIWHWTDNWKVEDGMSADKKTPDEVIDMIDAIGDVDLSKGSAISAARSAYDALTDEEKAQVTNYDKLKEAEEAYAELVAGMSKKLDEIYKTTGDFISGLGTPGVGYVGGEWMTIGLARSGRTVPDGYYENVVKYVKENADKNERLDRSKVTDNARIILALTAIGKDVTNVGGHNLLKGMDSMEFVQKQGINGPIWTLIALDSHNYPTMGDVTREKLIQVILDAQLSDGGWTLNEKADTDMTAMAIQALAPYYKTNETVKAAVDKALEVLSALQRNDGGFDSWGTVNSESCAQVIVALTALGIDPTADSRFVKNGHTVLDALAGFYVTGGGFKHTADGERNGMATEQGYYALAAYFRFVNGQTSLYDMSDVTIQIDSHTHAFGAWTVTTPATCTADGVETRSCACGETETRIIPATGHAFGAWTVTTPATCTTDGVETRSCACGETETRIIPATGHTFGDWTVTTPATCTADGVETRSCACGETETRIIPATGHAFSAWTVTTPATCTTDGVETRSCACGETETRIIPATGHVDADHDGKCDVCQAVITPVDPGKTDPTNPGTDTPATGDTGVLVWVIALPVALLAAAFVLKRKKREE